MFISWKFYNLLWLFPLFIISSLLANKSILLFNEDDSSEIIIDEFTGQIIPLIFIPFSVLNILSAFVLFRIFDIWKPFPISKADNIKNGWGIMLDDLIAGLVTLGLMQLIIQLG
jgi:phosphatidylglycerophosphatase A